MDSGKSGKASRHGSVSNESVPKESKIKTLNKLFAKRRPLDSYLSGPLDGREAWTSPRAVAPTDGGLVEEEPRSKRGKKRGKSRRKVVTPKSDSKTRGKGRRKVGRRGDPHSLLRSAASSDRLGTSTDSAFPGARSGPCLSPHDMSPLGKSLTTDVTSPSSHSSTSPRSPRPLTPLAQATSSPPRSPQQLSRSSHEAQRSPHASPTTHTADSRSGSSPNPSPPRSDDRASDASSDKLASSATATVTSAVASATGRRVKARASGGGAAANDGYNSDYGTSGSGGDDGADHIRIDDEDNKDGHDGTRHDDGMAGHDDDGDGGEGGGGDDEGYHHAPDSDADQQPGLRGRGSGCFGASDAGSHVVMALSPSPEGGDSDAPTLSESRSLEASDGLASIIHRDKQSRALTPMTAEIDLFAQGFGRLLETGEFSDFVLVVGAKRIRAHRVVVSYSSSVLMQRLAMEEKRSPTGPWTITVDLGDMEPSLFSSLLHFMYDGELEVTSENVVPLLAASEQLGMTGLRSMINDFVRNNVMRENAAQIIAQGIKLGASEIVDTCLTVLARNFAFLHRHDYSFMPPHVFLQLLRNDNLAPREEYSVFQAVSRYVSSRQDVTSDMAKEMMNCVRFRFLSYHQLQEAAENSSVDQEQLLMSTLTRLSTHEGGEASLLATFGHDPCLQPRPTFGIAFEYSKSLEYKGALYWLGTDSGRSPYTNPCVAGHVRVSASSLEKGLATNLLARVPTELWTKDVPASWFMIDFQAHRRMLPTHYTLRHGANYSGDFLRNWDLQASNDGSQWTPLRRHHNDGALTAAFGMATWTIPKAQQPYRYLRVLQTGHNSSKHNFLALSGIEFYGELFEDDATARRKGGAREAR